MFTGIVECVGRIVESRRVSGGRRLRIEAGTVASSCRYGDSLAINGVCLTVCDLTPPFVEFDVVAETLKKTTLDALGEGRRVNIERSLSMDGRLDGHFVQGHVDGTASVDRIIRSGGDYLLRLLAEAHLEPLLIPKGSVALDGVSLTIAESKGRSFSVALIPTTLEKTTLAELSAGMQVNVETDIIVRTIVHRLSRVVQTGGLTLETLQAARLA